MTAAESSAKDLAGSFALAITSVASDQRREVPRRHGARRRYGWWPHARSRPLFATAGRDPLGQAGLARALLAAQAHRAIDQRQMRERLRKIADQALFARIVFFAQEPD